MKNELCNDKTDTVKEIIHSGSVIYVYLSKSKAKKEEVTNKTERKLSSK